MDFAIILYYIVVVIVLLFIAITIYEIIKYRIYKRKSFQHKSNTDIDAENKISEELAEAKKLVLITTGNCNPEFYNRKKVISSLTNAAKKGIYIKVISGEIEKPGNNPIIKLSDSFSNVGLYIYPEKYLYPHFRIIDNKNLFVEELHNPEEKRRYFSYFVNNSFLVKKYVNLFYELLSKSKRMPSKIDFKSTEDKARVNA